MTSQEYAEAMLVHSRLWSMFAPPSGTYEIWKPLLIDLEGPVVTAALYSLATEEGREFAPNAGQIRRRAVELGSVVPSLDQALAEVWGAVSRIGYCGSPEWSCPAVSDAVEAMGGWRVVCGSESPDMFRAQFARVYGSTTGRQQREAVMPPAVRELVGRLDLSAQRALEGPKG